MTLTNVRADGSENNDMSGVIIGRENENLYLLIEKIKPKVKEDIENELKKRYESQNRYGGAVPVRN